MLCRIAGLRAIVAVSRSDKKTRPELKERGENKESRGGGVFRGRGWGDIGMVV